MHMQSAKRKAQQPAAWHATAIRALLLWCSWRVASRERPRFAILPLQETVRLIITDELLCLRIPFYAAAAEAQGDVAEMGDGDGAVRSLRRRDHWLARVDAIQ